VGDEVSEPFSRRFGDDVVTGRKLDLGLATERALLEAGCATVERNARCTSCEADLFFSHRRDRGHTGRQGVIAYIA
jgi:copper oxidase (laccase) domain-containing protein